MIYDEILKGIRYVLSDIPVGAERYVSGIPCYRHSEGIFEVGGQGVGFCAHEGAAAVEILYRSTGA